MITAVAEKMKSERMKTELITNVSHDIKTPLTSIINYADLIGKERTDNDNIKEYTEVLLRQSERLKRLIEDLVEASKASTGNLEVELAPCEASMFITQIAGEYEEKLEKSGLTLVTKINCDSIKIMADGRRMLRVFDNLMNNICKYALENSRVYLSLDAQENNLVMITFKNTSKAELDMSPEELMERFVRGDQSRNTEGNGLGLSIARSLTELQGGTFDISIDGDLFKVILTFPAK
jgi:signal transduction histidine kinase